MWKVVSTASGWWIEHPSKGRTFIGPATMRGVNNYDKASAEAERRNKAERKAGGPGDLPRKAMAKKKPKYESMAAIKRANKKAGRHWFDASTMRFFNSRIHTTRPIAGRYFVSSERMDDRFPWKYTVHEATAAGEIETIGEFQQFATKEAAVAYAKKLALMGKDVPDNPVKQGYSRETIAANVGKLRREGYSEKQSVAIAYSAARVSWRRRHVRGAFPAHLRGKR